MLRPNSCLGVLAVVSLPVLTLTTNAEAQSALFLRGDVNESGKPVDISDAMYTLGCLFLGTDCPQCPDAADTNDDGELDFSDAVYTLLFLFAGGPPPPAPWPDCGVEATADGLGECKSFRSCNQPPSAIFTASPANGEAPLEVTLDASASSDPDGTVLSFEWEFGDGRRDSGAVVKHTYFGANRYWVVLTVTDDSGLSDSTSIALPVRGVTVGGRELRVRVPPAYDPASPAPLVLLLHGFGPDGGVGAESYLRLTPLADASGFLYAFPDGPFVDADGFRFWIGFRRRDLDEPGTSYLLEMIGAIQARYSIDHRRVYLVGHSNGAFKAYHMACTHGELIAGIVSFGGGMLETRECSPAAPVHILCIHGTSDEVVSYTGGTVNEQSVLPVETTVESWAGFNGCDSEAELGSPLDLTSTVPGSDTTVASYETGCAPGGSAKLWTIQGGIHVPSLSQSFAWSVVDWLLAHPKP